MRILLTNDDGIDAPGLLALHEALHGLGEIVPIAPAAVQSATSHGVTFREPLMCEEVLVDGHLRGLAVDGRPADCVKLALRAIWPERYGPGSRPDLTISGMNTGANVGINIIYSGTVAAAVESAFLGVPAIAVSLHFTDPARIRYRLAAERARRAIDLVLRHPLDDHGVININIPRTEGDEDNESFPPIRVVAMNAAAGTEGYERRVSPGGKVYYWATGDGMSFAHTAPESDVEALFERCITVTPLTYALTDAGGLEKWRARLEGEKATGRRS